MPNCKWANRPKRLFCVDAWIHLLHFHNPPTRTGVYDCVMFFLGSRFFIHTSRSLHRRSFASVIGCLLVITFGGCASDESYDSRVYSEGSYYESSDEFRYETRRRELESRGYYQPSYNGTYHSRPPYRYYEPRRRVGPDNNVERDRVRDRDQQRDHQDRDTDRRGSERKTEKVEVREEGRENGARTPENGARTPEIRREQKASKPERERSSPRSPNR